jgi:NADPH:quinone reductase-like Zn-dependent oxidoreductase
MIDYRAVDFAEQVRDVDVAFEVIGGDYAMRSVRVLKPGGLLITAVERSNATLAAAVEKSGRRFAGITVEPDQVGLEAMARLVDAGRLKIHVDRVFPMTEIAAAHALLEAGHLKGKLVVTV